MHSDEVRTHVNDAMPEPFHDAVHSNLGLTIWESAVAESKKEFSFSASVTFEGIVHHVFCAMCSICSNIIKVSDAQKRNKINYILSHVPAHYMAWSAHDDAVPLCSFHAGCVHPEIWCTLTNEPSSRRETAKKVTTTNKNGVRTETDTKTPTAFRIMTIQQWLDGMHMLEQGWAKASELVKSKGAYNPIAVEPITIQPADLELPILAQDPILAIPLEKARAYLKTIRVGIWNPKCNPSGKSLSIETEIWSNFGMEDTCSIGLRREHSIWLPKPSAHWEPPKEDTLIQLMGIPLSMNGEPAGFEFKHEGKVHFIVNYSVLRSLLEPDINAVSKMIVDSAAEASRTIDWGVAIQDALVAANFESFKRSMDKFGELPNEVIRRLIDVWIANQIHES